MSDYQAIKKTIRVFLMVEFCIQPFGPFDDRNLFNAAIRRLTSYHLAKPAKKVTVTFLPFSP